MRNNYQFRSVILAAIFLILPVLSSAQPQGIKWSADGNSYFRTEKNAIVRYGLPDNTPVVVISPEELTPAGKQQPLRISYFSFDEINGKVLLFTNTKRVWRLNTLGDYWVFSLKDRSLKKLGKGLPESSLMFAKLSPDGSMAAYVSGNNLYAEDLTSSEVKALTKDGTVTLINGTFDWAYEEEFFCRDGFRWSPDSKSIAFWQIDAGSIKKFNMINNTDSIYPRVIPIEYPIAGEDPSSARIGMVKVADGAISWMKIPGDPVQNYLVRMEYVPSGRGLLVQQINRKQNQSRLYLCNPDGSEAGIIQEESDEAWVDLVTGKNPYIIDYTNGFTWMNNGASILWTSEKDGWRHMYEVSLQGKPERLLTPGEYDIISFEYIDSKAGLLWFTASPENATQKYLYKTSLRKPGKPELVSPESQKGTHGYNISPNGKYAMHTFSNHFTKPGSELLLMPAHKPVNESQGIEALLDSRTVETTTEFFTVTIPGGTEMDGWISKPAKFDPSKKYPVLFSVYTEPAGTTVTDTWGVEQTGLYSGDLLEDGYICISMDNRGTPAPKGRAWRKAIYRNIGIVNIDDQAMGARELLKKWSFLDPERIAVHGWSGGGTATLNLMFRYPDIYKTGIAVAAVANMFTYDNIYQERYMGLPQENKEDYLKGSPLTHARNLQGNLLYIHGTGDDNVHYSNAEMLINELVKHRKQFQVMPYPNRTHGISEGEGTGEHLSALFTAFLRKNCPPGPR